MDTPDLYAIIMAGGSGTRFWPASRRTRPKQFLRISSGLPLLTETWLRLDGLVPPERVLVVTTADQEQEVRRTLPELPEGNVLAEPEARNTGPAVALADFEVKRRASDSVQIVLPADHVIRPKEAFHRSLKAAAEEANQLGSLVVFGIRPSHPATGFGYIEAGEMSREVNHTPVYRVRRFVEKPSLQRAQEFLFQGSFFWNAGIFVWHTDAICRALADYMPDAYAGLSKPRKPAELARIYSGLPAESIDVAVMERAPNVRMLPVDYVWSDIGSWDALASVLPTDSAGNVASGGATAMFEDARGCIVHSEPGEIVAVLGLQNVVVVHAGEATLVCDRARVQDVRRLVERLKEEGREHL
jgi:mannose-1-phosphate guanylyltransferase